MKFFLHKTKLLTLVFIISVTISILKVVTIDTPEWFDGAEEWFRLMDNLSLAYIASYFFYIVQVYIPEKKREESQIPLRAALQREVQFFTVWIVDMWKIFYEYAVENGELESKSKDDFLNSEKLLSLYDKIILRKECPYSPENTPDKSWNGYFELTCKRIIRFGDKIIQNRAADLPPDIYYAIFYLASESSTIFQAEHMARFFTLQTLDMSGFITLGQMIPKCSQGGPRDIDMDIESIKKLIAWVNQEHDFLHKQNKYSLAHIYKIDI